MPADASTPSLTELLEKVADGGILTAAEAEFGFDRFMDGTASDIQMAGLLIGLRSRGVRPAEVAGGVRALRNAMVPVASADPSVLVDTAGTGGGQVTTFNISTGAALVAAGAGIKVAKHGNRSFTSQCGSADVLEALGVVIQLSPERMASVLAEAGIVFMFAPLLHPAMRHVGSVRRGLGVTTVMNILGPLTNPAGARRQVIGVADPRLLDLVAGALMELGHLRAMVVHGEAGMDELSPRGPTRVAEVNEHGGRRYEVTPEELGLEPAVITDLAGGDPAHNARMIEQVLAGEEGSCRTAVVINAAAAIYVGGGCETLADGVAVAIASIDDGSAAAALERLRVATNSHAQA